MYLCTGVLLVYWWAGVLIVYWCNAGVLVYWCNTAVIGYQECVRKGLISTVIDCLKFGLSKFNFFLYLTKT